MDIAKLALEFTKALLSWPVVTIVGLLVFRIQIVALLDALRSLIDRIKKVDAFGVSAEVGEQLLQEAKPAPLLEAAPERVALSVSSGAYSTDYRAIFIVASLSNPTEQADQVVSWKLRFPTLSIELAPTPAPSNLIGGVPWWPSGLVPCFETNG